MRMLIKGSRTECLIDTGSEVNIIPAHLVEQDEVLPSCRVLQAANGTMIGVMGEVELPVQVADQCIKTRFVISDQVDEVLIGVQWLHENGCRNLIPRQHSDPEWICGGRTIDEEDVRFLEKRC